MSRTLLPVFFLLTMCASGCQVAPRIVYVPPGNPVKLAGPTQASIWVLVGRVWVRSADKAFVIPEGWTAYPPGYWSTTPQPPPVPVLPAPATKPAISSELREMPAPHEPVSIAPAEQAPLQQVLSPQDHPP